MPSKTRLVASLLSSTLVLASTHARAQSAPPPQAPPQAPVSAPPPQAPPPYVTPAPPAPQAYPPGGYPQQSYPAPPPGYAQQGMQPAQPGWRPPPPVRPSKALMITGISIFSSSYLIAMLTGGALLDGNRDDDDDDGLDCTHCKDVAPYLFIPLAGPFVAMSQTPNDGGLIVLGMVEMVGAALTIGGIVRYQNTKRAASFSGYSLELDQRRSLTFDVGTSPRMTGPRATLRF